jgi:hypothetical protein
MIKFTSWEIKEYEWCSVIKGEYNGKVFAVPFMSGDEVKKQELIAIIMKALYE